MESELNDLINIFKAEVERLNKKFSPEKSYEIIPLKLYGEKFLCSSKDNYFELNYDEERLIEDVLNNSEYTHKDLEEIFYYFARHEFGHSLLQDIVPILNQIDFHNRSIKSFCFMLLGKFKEYYADWFVNENFDEIPHKYLEQWALSLSVDRNVFTNPEFLQRISIYLGNNIYITGRFYIFKKWGLLRDFYHKNNLDSLYELLFEVFEKFKKICKDPLDLDLIKEELFKLARKLNEIDYRAILKIED